MALTAAGFVYVIGPVERTSPYLVKVGWSENVLRRRRNLQVGSPVRLEILCIIRADDSRLEKEVHYELAEFRRHGEWFELGDDPVARVKAAVEFIRETQGRAGWLRARGEGPAAGRGGVD